MIISINNEKENHFYKICSKTDVVYNKQFNNHTTNPMGRPKKYTDLQIIKCKLYMIMNNIYCLRELEWKLFNDQLAVSIIGLKEVPDHSTFAIRFRKLEQEKFNKLYRTIISLLEPDTRICAIDSTSLRSSKYDSEAKIGTSTRLGNYKGYKLHLIASNDALPLSFKCTTANVYDSNFNCCHQVMKPLDNHDPFILLGDAAYDSTKLFELANDLGFKLLTDINYRNADSIHDFTDQYRLKNGLYFNSDLGQKMYKNRLTIERLFAILKERYNLESPRLYGFQRYKSHVIWTLFLYLIEKLIDQENNITDNKFPWNR